MISELEWLLQFERIIKTKHKNCATENYMWPPAPKVLIAWPLTENLLVPKNENNKNSIGDILFYIECQTLFRVLGTIISNSHHNPVGWIVLIYRGRNRPKGVE